MLGARREIDFGSMETIEYGEKDRALHGTGDIR